VVTIALMKPKTAFKFLLAAASCIASGVMAGEPVQLSSKAVSPTVEAVDYEANRGLLTLQGPSGMFINPTSATLPAGAFTAQYCFFLPDFDFDDTIGHGALLAYGVTDWLELGALANFLQDAPGGGTDFAAGPMARVRLLKHDGWIPQFSVGGYGKIGAETFEQASAFAALTERFEVQAGPVESVAFHAGARETWTEDNDSFRGYFGLEIQLPARVYLVGEIATESSVDEVIPWAAGFQWRAGGINISSSVIEQGDGGDVGFFFGIGTQF
jgi:hypothetical protein